jgi:hypothetical protein
MKDKDSRTKRADVAVLPADHFFLCTFVWSWNAKEATLKSPQSITKIEQTPSGNTAWALMTSRVTVL